MAARFPKSFYAKSAESSRQDRTASLRKETSSAAQNPIKRPRPTLPTTSSFTGRHSQGEWNESFQMSRNQEFATQQRCSGIEEERSCNDSPRLNSYSSTPNPSISRESRFRDAISPLQTDDLLGGGNEFDSIMNVPLPASKSEMDSQFVAINRKLELMTDELKEKVDGQSYRIEQLMQLMTDVSEKLTALTREREKFDNSKRVSKELARAVKSLYNLLPENEQWDLDEVFTASRNAGITNRFGNDMYVHLKERFTLDQIRSAAHTYFMSMRKEHLLKERFPEKHQDGLAQKKLRARRQRLYEIRSKYVAEEELEMWSKVTQECMSDEEDLGDALKVKSPPWRSAELTGLLKELDERGRRQNQIDSRQVIRKRRLAGESPMKRKPSNRLNKDLLE